MLKAYNIRYGVIFAFFISLLAYITRIIRLGLEEFALRSIALFLSLITCWLIQHFFLLHSSWGSFKRVAKTRAVSSIAISLAVVYLINDLFGNNSGAWPAWNLEGPTSDYRTVFNLIRAAVTSGFCYFAVYSLQVNQQLEQSRLENEYLKQDQLKAQLFSLQEELIPYFLFSSLNTLQTLAPNSKARTYVVQLANVYRYLLTFNEHPRITVRSELTFVKSYLYVLQERFEEALQVSIQVSEALLDFYIPPLTLQILVENAIKHNVISPDQPLYLHIYTNDSGSMIVENSYQPKLSVAESNGKGLQNIKDRYKLLAGKKVEVYQEAGLFIVILPLLIPS